MYNQKNQTQKRMRKTNWKLMWKIK